MFHVKQKIDFHKDLFVSCETKNVDNYVDLWINKNYVSRGTKSYPHFVDGLWIKKEKAGRNIGPAFA